MGNFKLYLNKLSYRHAGRLWARSEGIKATCMSMFYLNRTVSHYQVHSKAIYALKNRLVQWLYQNGTASVLSSKLKRLSAGRAAERANIGQV